MNFLTKRKICILCVLLAGIGIAIFFYCIISRRNKVYHHVLNEVYAIEHIDWDRIKPVDEETLALNPLRKKAGLTEIQRNWKIAPSNLLICDGPMISLVLNEQDIPMKVISSGSGWAWPDPNNQTSREFDIVDYKLNGRAATWIGRPEKLYIVETYEDNVLNGPTICFSATGEKICQCVFDKGKPWNGRTLQRAGFNAILADASYKEGKLDGAEIFYSEGKLDRLRTFKEGVLDGLQQWHYEGRLRDESIIESGILLHFRSWHQNGILREDTTYNNKGKLDGVRRMWDESGELEVEEHYRNGKEHGWRWWKGHSPEGVWFWKGKFLGAGDDGKAEFKRREVKK